MGNQGRAMELPRIVPESPRWRESGAIGGAGSGRERGSEESRPGSGRWADTPPFVKHGSQCLDQVSRKSRNRAFLGGVHRQGDWSDATRPVASRRGASVTRSNVPRGPWPSPCLGGRRLSEPCRSSPALSSFGGPILSGFQQPPRQPTSGTSFRPSWEMPDPSNCYSCSPSAPPS